MGLRIFSLFSMGQLQCSLDIWWVFNGNSIVATGDISTGIVKIKQNSI